LPQNDFNSNECFCANDVIKVSWYDSKNEELSGRKIVVDQLKIVKEKKSEVEKK